MKMMIWMMKTMTILILMDPAQVELQEIVVKDFQWLGRVEAVLVPNLLAPGKVEAEGAVSTANVELEFHKRPIVIIRWVNDTEERLEGIQAPPQQPQMRMCPKQ